MCSDYLRAAMNGHTWLENVLTVISTCPLFWNSVHSLLKIGSYPKVQVFCVGLPENMVQGPSFTEKIYFCFNNKGDLWTNPWSWKRGSTVAPQIPSRRPIGPCLLASHSRTRGLVPFVGWPLATLLCFPKDRFICIILAWVQYLDRGRLSPLSRETVSWTLGTCVRVACDGKIKFLYDLLCQPLKTPFLGCSERKFRVSQQRSC